MENSVFPYRLYLVVSETSCKGRDIVEVTEAAIQGGVDLVQLREKDLTTELFLSKSLRLQEMLSKYNVPLIINDDLAVASAAHAYGIHVGNSDIAPTTIRLNWPTCNLLGYSIEYEEQLFNEQTAVSDYLGISPVFSTSTKQDTVVEWKLEGIRKIRSLTAKPLVAIGNMNVSNAYDVIKAGADCIAVVSAICANENPAQAAYEIRNQIEKAR